MNKKGTKILLVDDEPDTLRLVHQILQAEGAEVVEAVDGRQALELYEKEHPDMIILDIIIPHIVCPCELHLNCG